MGSKPADPTALRIYAICVEGELGEDWAEWFGDLEMVTDAQRHTVLTGPIADQAALFGLLTRLRDLGLPLRSVNLVGGAPD